MPPKRKLRERVCSETAPQDDNQEPPPDKIKRRRKGTKEDGTIWKDDPPEDNTVTITLVVGGEEDEDEDDESYVPSEEDEEIIQYLLDKYVSPTPQPKKKVTPNKRTKKEKEEPPPIKLTRSELAYYNRQPPEKKKELLEHMKRVSTHVLDEGEIPNKFRILELPIADYVKSTVIKKLTTLSEIQSEGGEGHKLRNWVDAFMRIPFGKTVPLPVTIKDGPQKCTEFMVEARKQMNKHIYGMEPAKLQIMQVLAQWVVNPSAVGNVIALQGPMGVGKCHAKDTPILMYDGTIKLVQNIEIGDVIMGDNSTPRKVLNLGRGRDQMYDIIPTKGEKYTVNSEHILCVKQSGRGIIKPMKLSDGRVTFKTIRFNNKSKKLNYKTFDSYENADAYLSSFTEEDNITEISVKDYLQIPKDVRNNWLKGYKKSVEFPHVPTDFDPYIIGLWLGDGTSSKPQITSQDSTILGYLNTNLRKYDLMLNYISKYDYYIRSYKKNENTFLKILQKHNLINNKHIPQVYKINDRQTRLKILAGIIDSDGYLWNNCYEVSQKSDILANDIMFLGRSLGFACYSTKREKSCMYKGEKKSGIYNIITISGDIHEIPVIIERKKASERRQIKDVLVSAIDVKCIGEGDYYGFTLDGNNRYLMGDFTVTHNTSFARNAIADVLKRPFEFFTLGGASDIANYIGHSYTYEGSLWGRIADSLMHAKTMNPVMYFDELDKISTTPQGEEIVSMLIHMTDASQNSQFHDRFFAGVDFDLSQCLFVFSFNDIDKVHPILRDRMTVIHCSGYNDKDKSVILKDYIWPVILDRLKFDSKDILLSDNAIKYLISEYSSEEKGVRTLIRTVDSMMTRINMLRIANDESMKDYKFYMDIKFPLTITEDVVKKILCDLAKKDIDESWRTLYT
jgi:DNA polymerase III delta prime subunit